MISDMVTRIVVADQGDARFYDRAGMALRAAGSLENPAAHLRNRDFKSDRQGRIFSRVREAGQRRGAVARHAAGSERSPRKRAAELFAKRITRELSAAYRAKSFDGLVLVAGPAFLGLLRAALTKSLKSAVVGEVAKDLVHLPKTALRAHLPPRTAGRPARRPGN
jgi:protein required for attachment to host cells